MSSYTMELREIIEQSSQYNTSLSTKDKIETGRTQLFNFDYPIFHEDYRKDFETHFIRNFYMREIGFETEGLFKFRLETWLMINMPYFNKLFESELLIYDPLTNSKRDSTNDKTQNDTRNGIQHSDISGTGNVTENQSSTTDGTNNKTGSSDLTEDNFDRKLKSDTPDGRLNLTATDGEGVIEYASNIEEENENNHKTATNTENDTVHSSTSGDTTQNSNTSTIGDSTTNDTLDSTVNETQHSEGKVGAVSYAKLLQEHRETFLRIEREIFQEMQELFMLVY